MGTVNASDYAAAMDGKIPWDKVRELCPRHASEIVLRSDNDDKGEDCLRAVGWVD